jgi:hypothetical protein
MPDKPGYLESEGGITRKSMKLRYKFDNAKPATSLIFGLEISHTLGGISNQP